jgi:Xaa-Pro dipeptidase
MYQYRIPGFHEKTPAPEIQSRIEHLRSSLDHQGLDAALIVHPVDLFYYSGTMQAGHLLIPADESPLLMIRRELSRAKKETRINDVVSIKNFRDLGAYVKERMGDDPRRLGLELDVVPVEQFQRYQEIWPHTAFINFSPAIMAQRAVKSPFEMGKMQKAGEIATHVYGQIPDLLNVGVTEIELAGLISSIAYAKGHQNYLRARAFNQEVYTWHVISGKSGGIVSCGDAPFGGYGLSPAFPYGASQKKIQKKEPILVDFGICIEGYQVDLTRMFSIGPVEPLLSEAYQALQTIDAKLRKCLYPGNSGKHCYEVAVDSAADLGFAEAFLGPAGLKARFVGHGLGLEISEPPYLAPGNDKPLQNGMTVALELKMVFPGRGAVGLENTLYIGGDGPVNLTPVDEGFIEV